MPVVKPFKALLPAKDKVHLVASRSYVTYTDEQLKDKLDNNPFTFLHVIHPHGIQETPAGFEEKNKRVRKAYLDFLQKGVFQEFERDALYIYQQIKQGHLFTGFIGAASVEAYYAGKIKKHEHTLTAREELFKNYLQSTRINAEPVLLAYPENAELEEHLAAHTSRPPFYDFTTSDEVRHRFWPVADPTELHTIQRAFASIDSFYIADGHHRCASSALLGREEKADHEQATDYFMVYLIPDTQLQILDFNRLVRNLNGLSPAEFINRLEPSFHIEPLGESICIPQKIHHLSMYLEGNWYSLTCKPHLINTDDPVKQLDAHLLSEHVLDPILDITDLKTDPNVHFMGGHKGMNGLKQAVDTKNYSVAFGLFPVSIDHLKRIADSGLSMPPKSTWIEPKLRSGLVIYPL